MSKRVELSCRCGSVTGHLELEGATTYNCATCYCDDCQAFAHYLGRNDLLDAWGGTDIVQVPPSRMHIDQGADQLRCMRLTHKGLLRWYTACCRTPAGNMLATPRSPFVGLSRKLFVKSESAALLAPSMGGMLGKFAHGTPPAHVARNVTPKIIGKSALFFGRSLITQAWKSSPFLLRGESRFLIEPTILSPSQREDLRMRAKESTEVRQYTE